MNLSKEHIDFENESNHILGKVITKVEYAEIAYHKLNGDSNPTARYLTSYNNLDSIDYSIFLHTETGEIIEIYWDDKFFQYGIGIKLDEPSVFTGFQRWNVSSNNLWRKFIGATIKTLNITWEKVITTNDKNDVSTECIYPQDIELTFSNEQKIFISAADFSHNNNEVFGMSDNITVTDNEELARKVKMIN